MSADFQNKTCKYRWLRENSLICLPNHANLRTLSPFMSYPFPICKGFIVIQWCGSGMLLLVQWISRSFLNERTWSQTNTTNIYRPFCCRQFHHLNPTEGVHWEVEPVYRAILSEFAALMALTRSLIVSLVITYWQFELIYYEMLLGHTSAPILNTYWGRLYVEEFSPPHQLFYRVYSEIQSYSPIKPQKPGISQQHMPDGDRCSPVCWF